jgi:hypothetical protein
VIGRGDIYARMEAQMRGAPDRRPLRWILVEGAIIVGIVFLLGYMLYAAQFSGSVRWILGFLLIAALAAFAWTSVAKRTSEPRPLAKPAARARPRTGELTAFASTVGRAHAGLPYSQVSVSSRAREAFAEHARLARGLSPDAMRRLQADPAALKRSFHDPILEDFLFLATTDSDERYRWVEESRRRGGFVVALDQVLDRMEAWR